MKSSWMIRKMAFLALLLTSCVVITAQDKDQNLKVCVYDPDILTQQSKECNELLLRVDKEFQPKFDEVKKEEQLLVDSANKLQAKASMISEAALKNEQTSLMRRKRDLETQAKSIMEDYQVERQNAGMNFLKKLEQGITSFSDAYGYDIVIPKGPGMFAMPRADQTSAVVTHMNKAYDSEKKMTVAAGVRKQEPIKVAKK